VLALLVWFAVGAARRETLPDVLRPDSIAAKSDVALANVVNNPPPPPDKPRRPLWPVPLIRGFGPFSIRPIADRRRRSEPTIFPLTELRATTLRGAVGINGQLAVPPGALPIPPGVHLPGPQSSGNAKGRRFILLTGIVPEQMQRQAYDADFRDALKPPAVIAAGMGAGIGAGIAGDVSLDRFTPRYVWCRLERTDTTTGAVKLLDFGDPQEAAADGTAAEPRGAARMRFSPEYRKMLNDVANWNPKIAEVADADCVGPSWLTWPLPPLLLHDWGPEAAHPPQIALAPAPAPALAAAQPAPIPPAAARGGDEEKAAPFKLFRFADFDVQPGHAYRYSVQLVLRNPNYGLDGSLLTRRDIADSPYLFAPWSQKSAAVAIPPDARVLAAGISLPRKGPAQAKLAIMVWDQGEAMEFVLDLTRDRDSVSPGALLNFTGRVVKDMIDPIRRCVCDLRHDFITDAVLLDVRGDPGEVLLLDFARPGKPRLVIADEAADRPVLDAWRATHKLPAGVAMPGPNNGLIPAGNKPQDARPPGR